MRALAVLLVAVAGCYHPSYRDCDVSCASGAGCPSGLVCHDNMCRVPGATDQCGAADGGIDGDLDGNVDGPPGLAPFGRMVRLDELASGSADQDPALRDDQLEIIFSSNRTGTLGAGDLWSATRANTTDAFSNITNLGNSINTAQDELHPWLSGNGLVLYFISARSGTTSIYRSSRNGLGQNFSSPLLVQELDSTMNEGSVSLTPDQLTVVIDSDRLNAPERDLYIATRSSAGIVPFGTPTLIGSLDVSGADRNSPALIGDTAMYFVEVNSTGPTILRSTRSGSTFGTPQPLTELGHASDPWVSQDEKTIYFSSSMAGTLDIYMATRP